jgi:hypothetical protein
MGGRHVCRVCGRREGWSIEALEYEHYICPCCGFHYGYTDDSIEGAKRIRAHWITVEGARWVSDAERPQDWSLQDQLENIPSEYR